MPNRSLSMENQISEGLNGPRSVRVRLNHKGETLSLGAAEAAP